MAKYNTSANNIFRNQPVNAPASGTAYTAVFGTDRFIDVVPTAAFALTLPAPSASTIGAEFTIKDSTGVAGSFNITVTPASGTIDGAASFVISTAYGAVTVYNDGTNYFISSEDDIPVGMPWVNVSTATQTLSGNVNYYVTNATLATLTLPASPTAGQTIKVVGTSTNAAFYKIAQNATQQIFLGNSSSTVGATGYVQSSAVGDAISLLCTTGGTAAVWTAYDGLIGNFLIN